MHALDVLGDPVRRRLLELLADGELRAGELGEVVQHEFGIETRYGHLNAIRVEVGQRVSRGDRIGDMGNSGRSTGTHLHYEVRVNGTAVNPLKFIRAASNVF